MALFRMSSWGSKRIALNEEGRPLMGEDNKPIEFEPEAVTILDAATAAATAAPAPNTATAAATGTNVPDPKLAAMQDQIQQLTAALDSERKQREVEQARLVKEKADREAAQLLAERKAKLTEIKTSADSLCETLSKGNRAFGATLEKIRTVYCAAAIVDMDGSLSEDARKELGITGLASALADAFGALPAHKLSEQVSVGDLGLRHALALPNRTDAQQGSGVVPGTAQAGAATGAIQGSHGTHLLSGSLDPTFDESTFRQMLAVDSHGREILKDPQRYEAAKLAAMLVH